MIHDFFAWLTGLSIIGFIGFLLIQQVILPSKKNKS